MATPGKLSVELVQDDVREQRRERRALRHALIDADHDTVRQNHLGCQQPPDQDEQPTIPDSLREPGHQALVVDAIEELLQIDVDHPCVPVVEVLAGLGDCRVATAARSEPVT